MAATGEPLAFLSYARKDTAIVDALDTALRRAGIDVWRDTAGITVGDQWREEIGTAIRASRAVVFAVTERSAKSVEVLSELEFAREEHIPILPVYLEPLDEPLPTRLRMLLAGLHFIELFADFDSGVSSVAGAILERTEAGTGDGAPTDFASLEAMGPTAVAQLATDYERDLSNGRFDARKLVLLGQCYLYLGRFEDARDRLRRVARDDPTSSTAAYSLALAVIGGRRPIALTMREAEGITRLLERAATNDPQGAHYECLEAVVKADYYETNGLLVPPPSVDTLIDRAAAKTLDPGEWSRILGAVEIAPDVRHRVFGT